MKKTAKITFINLILFCGFFISSAYANALRLSIHNSTGEPLHYTLLVIEGADRLSKIFRSDNSVAYNPAQAGNSGDIPNGSMARFELKSGSEYRCIVGVGPYIIAVGSNDKNKSTHAAPNFFNDKLPLLSAYQLYSFYRGAGEKPNSDTGEGTATDVSYYIAIYGTHKTDNDKSNFAFLNVDQDFPVGFGEGNPGPNSKTPSVYICADSTCTFFANINITKLPDGYGNPPMLPNN